MDQNGLRAQVYHLLAARLYPTEPEVWEEIGSGRWAAELRQCLAALGLPLSVPDCLGACPPEAAEREYVLTFMQPNRSLRPIESLFKPWTADPTAELPLAREKGWLGGDPAAHLRDLYAALGVEIPRELHHAPDHLALELSMMGLLVEHGSREQQEQFRSQHLDWLPELATAAQERQAAPTYQALFTLIAEFVAADAEAGTDARAGAGE